MKYIRKIVAMIIAVVMLAAVAIGMGVMFAVKNVNVTLLSYSCPTESDKAKSKISEFKTEILNEVRGKIISSVGEKKVSSAVKDENYSVVELKKVYPCTLNVTIKERKEVFYTLCDYGGFYVFDENGSCMRIADDESDACNPDGVANLFVESADGTDLLPYSDKVANICMLFESKFGSLRSVVEKAVLLFGLENTFTFNFRSGIKIIVYDYDKLTKEKVDEVFDYMKTLSGEQKLGGEIHCVGNENSQIYATYRESL